MLCPTSMTLCTFALLKYAHEVSWSIPHAAVEADDLLKPIKKIKSSSKNYVQSFCKCFETQRLRSALSRSCEIQLQWMEAMCEDRAGPQPVQPGWAVTACGCSMSSGKQGVHLKSPLYPSFSSPQYLESALQERLGMQQQKKYGTQTTIIYTHINECLK